MSGEDRKSKNRSLRQYMVNKVNSEFAGEPFLGCALADATKVEVARLGIMTTAEVLMKELRHAARRGELKRSHRYINRRSFVHYSPAGSGDGVHPRAQADPPGDVSPGFLMDPNDLTPPPHRRD